MTVTVSCTDPSTVRGYELRDALVAVQVEGEEAAVVGVRDLASGTLFELYAVLRADRDSEVVYFTEAEALEVDGTPVPQEQLLPWPEGRRARVRWFTIEGTPPYSEWPERERFPRYSAVFRPDWGSGWSVPGDVRPRNSNLAFGTEDLGPHAFGTARYHVRVEVYAPGSTEVPIGRYPSPAVVGDGEGIDERASGVVVTLPPPLAPASAVFGLPQVEEVPPESEARVQFAEMADAGLLFSRTWVLRRTLDTAGLEWERIDWHPVDLAPDSAEAAAWGEVVAGDVLRVGERLVFVLRDNGQGDAGDATAPGVVDYSDLCLDFSRGAAVRPLGDVFSGGGEVEWGSLGDDSSR